MFRTTERLSADQEPSLVEITSRDRVQIQVEGLFDDIVVQTAVQTTINR
jgi:hypothetical protein